MTEERPSGPNAGNRHGNGGSQVPAPLRLSWTNAPDRDRDPQKVWVDDGPRWSDPTIWDASARRINRLSMVIQVLGAASILLGLTSIAFLWPRVRLLWLIGFTGMGILGGLTGVLLRGLHHKMLGNLGRGVVGYRFYRTRVNRCRAGLFVCGLMLAAGVTLERVMARLGNPAPGASSNTDQAQAGPRWASGTEFVGPREMYANGDLRLRVATAFMEPSRGGKSRLQVILEASNAGPVLKIDLDRIQDIERPLERMATLIDDFQNRYQAVERPELVLEEDFSAPTSLYPGDRLRVRLVFEPPVAQARLLKLSIPGDSFDLDRQVVFEINTRDLDPPPRPSARRTH